MLALNPAGVGIEEEEEDHGEGHDVHVKKQHDAAVVEAPFEAEAAEGFVGSPERADDGEGEGPVGVDLWESGEEQGGAEAGQDHEGPTAK